MELKVEELEEYTNAKREVLILNGIERMVSSYPKNLFGK